jgi:glyoxylase-like metal-dependent hydrolase (beta-lactamase superfamily II)
VRVLRPAPEVYAFYAGRDGELHDPARRNWVDEGALKLGIASYAIVAGDHALVYDTHVSVAHAHAVRAVLEAAGVTRFTVVLSHWHLDHVAGTAAFADADAIIAHERTAEILKRDRAAIESGTLEGPPAIDPLVLPTDTFADRMELTLGDHALELRHVDVHSDDAAILWWPERRLLLAGDTLEDTITYVDMPGHFPQHLEGLRAIRALRPGRILPNHGDPDVIAAGGYAGTGLVDATTDYINLLRRRDPAPLRELLAPRLAAGDITYHAPYEAVHAHNLGLDF